MIRESSKLVPVRFRSFVKLGSKWFRLDNFFDNWVTTLSVEKVVKMRIIVLISGKIKKRNPLIYKGFLSAPWGIRTHDLLIRSQLLQGFKSLILQWFPWCLLPFDNWFDNWTVIFPPFQQMLLPWKETDDRKS